MAKLLPPQLPPSLMGYMDRRMRYMPNKVSYSLVLADYEMQYEQEVIDFYGLAVIKRFDGGHYVELKVKGGKYGQATQ